MLKKKSKLIKRFKDGFKRSANPEQEKHSLYMYVSINLSLSLALSLSV